MELEELKNKLKTELSKISINPLSINITHSLNYIDFELNHGLNQIAEDRIKEIFINLGYEVSRMDFYNSIMLIEADKIKVGGTD